MAFGILVYEIFIFFVTVILLYAYIKLSHKYHWFDQPDEDRKLHSKVVPTAAGLVFMLPVLIFFFISSISEPFNTKLIAAGLLIFMILGGYDDFKPISAKIRLLIIFIISSIFVYLLFVNNSQNYLLLGLYIVGLIWWLNLFNFMDGADGMAGLHALITACSYIVAYVFLPNSIDIMGLYILLFVFCILAFLVFNFPKAKLFMGDAGSLPVAFTLGSFALYGISNNVFGEILVISFHLAFIVDATLTLLTRLKFKQNITHAHNLHLFQLLIRNGKPHAVVSSYYAIVTLILVTITLYLHSLDASLMIKSVALAVEIIILAYFWYYFQNKTKFKQFHR